MKQETTSADKRSGDLVAAIADAVEVMAETMGTINRRLRACLPDGETMESMLLRLQQENEVARLLAGLPPAERQNPEVRVAENGSE